MSLFHSLNILNELKHFLNYTQIFQIGLKKLSKGERA